jgi:integrase
VSKTELEIALLARKTKQIELLPKVKVFLEAISRNSIKSKRSYSSGITLLQHFLNENEQKQRYHGCNCETIIFALLENKINVYELFDRFVSYVLAAKSDIARSTLSFYLAALRSYFVFYDIDIIPSKFRRKVKVPKLYKEDEEPLDASDIRKIILNCSNRRLKAYLLVLGSGGMRAVEATAIRLRDIDFTSSPTKVHIRKEYAKTRVARDIYISEEATKCLKQWIEWKYRVRKEEKKKESTKTANMDDLVFGSSYSINREANPSNLYVKLIHEFQKLLAYIKEEKLLSIR